MKKALAIAAVVSLVAAVGVAWAEDHHHHVRPAKPNGSGKAGMADTGHEIHTHAVNGKVHKVTLKHPASNQHIGHTKIVAKGRRGKRCQEGAGEIIGLDAGMRPAPEQDQVQVWIGWMFVVTDSFGNAHVVYVWLPLSQVDPGVADSAEDIG
jgi:hypothetical protein